MPKRILRPLYPHDGFTMRPIKMLASGDELLACTERQTAIKCTACGRRAPDGSISLTKPHTGHVSDDGIVKAKLARVELKSLAQTTTMTPRDILHETKTKFGARSLVVAGTVSNLNRVINRQRDENCPDTAAVDSNNPIFQGKMTVDNDNERFLIFDETCPQTNKRHVAFGSPLALEVLEQSKLVLTDGTFDVAQPPFGQLWCIHAKFGDAMYPIVHVLMSARTIQDYEFVIQKLTALIPNWNPSEYLGDLEIGQCKAFSNTFPHIRRSFCYFHLVQAWHRKLKQLKLDGLINYGSSMYEFWSLLKCLPFGDATMAYSDFQDLWNLIPTPVTADQDKFKTYFENYYLSARRNPLYPVSSWNVVSRTIRELPRTTNSVEASHRNLERCIRSVKGRSTPLLSELIKCLKQESSKIKFDKESMDFDPTYKVSSERKIKDMLKDQRIINVISNSQLQGIPLLKAIRAAKKYR